MMFRVAIDPSVSSKFKSKSHSAIPRKLRFSNPVSNQWLCVYMLSPVCSFPTNAAFFGPESRPEPRYCQRGMYKLLIPILPTAEEQWLKHGVPALLRITPMCPGCYILLLVSTGADTRKEDRVLGIMTFMYNRSKYSQASPDSLVKCAVYLCSYSLNAFPYSMRQVVKIWLV